MRSLPGREEASVSNLVPKQSGIKKSHHAVKKAPGVTESKAVVSSSDFFEDVFRHLIRRQRRLKLSCSFFLSQVPGLSAIVKDPMVEVMDKSIKQIANDLDILMIMENLQELPKLKKVILAREKRSLFNFIPKPYI